MTDLAQPAATMGAYGDITTDRRSYQPLDRVIVRVTGRDAKHGLVKRGHTCDTWDFEIHESGEFVGRRAVVANCDQSGYYAAYLAMAEMWAHLGKPGRAEGYQSEASDYRRRANESLWDGTKYVHHVHLEADISWRQQLEIRCAKGNAHE